MNDVTRVRYRTAYWPIPAISESEHLSNLSPASFVHCTRPIELMASRVDIVPWTESPALTAKWRESVTNVDNFRAWMQTPEWLNFRWKRCAKTHIATLHDGSFHNLIAITPLVEQPYLLPFSIGKRLLGNIHLNGFLLVGNEPLFPPSDEYYEALVSAALTMPCVDCLYMLGVPKASPFWNFLAKARKAQPQWLLYCPGLPPGRVFWIDTSMPYDEYLCKHKPKTLQEFRRKLRRLEQEVGGKATLVRIGKAEEVPLFVSAAHAIATRSRMRRLVRIVDGQIVDPQAFLESMARQGLLRAYLLRVGDKAVAYELGFQLNGALCFHETAFDSEYARFSPGQALFNMIVKDCFEVDKPKTIHYGPGDYAYKKMLANRCDEEVTIMIVRNTAGNNAKLMAHRLFRKAIEGSKSAIRNWVPAAQKPS